MTDRNKIAAIYNLGTDYEYQRLTQSPVHEAEFELTADLFRVYIRPKLLCWILALDQALR